MNRRRFLAGMGAAVATFAAVTRLGETTVAMAPRSGMEGDFDTGNLRYRPFEEVPGFRAPELSEESLEEICIEIKRYSHRVSILPTRVIYGSSS